MGSSGLIVSDLALGTMNFGIEPWGCDYQTSRRIIDAYLEAGGTFIDLANVYAGGESERIVGKCLEGRRHDVILATKCSAPTGPQINRRGSSRYSILVELEESLRRLQTDYLDLYYLHLWDPTTPFRESLSALTDLVRSGKVRYLGVSNYSGWQISELAALWNRDICFEPIVSAQEQYSLLFRGVELEVVPTCSHNGIGMVCFSPLAGGVLAGLYDREKGGPEGERYSAQGSYTQKFKKFYLTERNFDIYEKVSALAKECGGDSIDLSIAWLLGRPAVTSVLVGPRTPGHLHKYIEAAAFQPDATVLDQLDKISEPELPYPYSNQARYIPDFFGNVDYRRR